MMKNPGKKVGTLRVVLERKTSKHHHAYIEVELRLDVDRGVFYAKYEGVWYDALTKDELCDKVRKAAHKTIDIVWTRYLVIDYQAEAWPLEGDSGRPETSGGYETLSIDEGREGTFLNCESVVTSIDLHWRVFEISSPYILPEGKKKTVRMHRKVRCVRNHDGSGMYQEEVSEPTEQDDDKLPLGAVPWTAERESLLREIIVALGKLDARMVELFRGDPDEVARRLDTAVQDPARLLADST